MWPKKENKIDFITPFFPYNGICQRFREEAVRHGFMQRYPKGKEHITGIGHEPWHFRYVGIPHSIIITQMDMVLEEYMDWIRQFIFPENPYHFKDNGRAYMVGFVPVSHSRYFEVENIRSPRCTISGNNIDGFVAAVLGGEE